MQRTTTGDLMARMTNDLDAVRMCAGIGLVATFDAIILSLCAIGFMLYISPLLTLVCLAPMLTIIVITRLLSSRLMQRFKRVQEGFSHLTETVRETIAGIAVIKAYAAEGMTARRFAEHSREYVSRNLALVKIMGLFFPAIVVFSNLSIGVLLAAGGRLTVLGTITPGDFVAFASYLWILTWPMMALGWVINLFQRALVSMQRINSVLAEPAEDGSGNERAAPAKAAGALDIRCLTFTYPGAAAPALKQISLCVRPGETIGITGRTGAGKTTLCRLILRLFEPPAGCVLLDGRDIRQLNLAQVRDLVAYVPQDSFLLSDTIARNIAYGRHDLPAERIAQLAAAVGLAEEIGQFGNGYDTLVGERGVTLSGGQKQRVCIARALARQAPVLIIDDALSALDAATMDTVLETMRQAAGQRTCLVVSPRIAALRHTDRTVVMEAGEIVEAGTHAQLIARGGLYRRLYEAQKLTNGTDGE